MADVQIKDLEALTVNETSASDIYVVQFFSSTAGGFVTRKITSADLGACLNSQVGYTLVLETTAKTVLGAINEVNAKTGAVLKYASTGNTTIQEKVDAVEEAQEYQDGATIDLEDCILPLFDDGVNYKFTIPLSKPIASSLTASFDGNFTIENILNNDELSTIGTTTITITDIGLNVTITPNTYTALTSNYIIGATGAEINLTEES